MKRLILVIAVLALPGLALAQQDARYAGGILQSASAPPANGVNGVETLTFGGTITGGTFQIGFLGATSAPITWSATNATLLANINAALVAMNPVGAGAFTVAAGTLTNGIGTVTITASAGGNFAVSALVPMTIAYNNLTGTSTAVAISLTTAGTAADGRKSALGTLCIGSDGKLYQNLGSPLAPSWAKVSSE